MPQNYLNPQKDNNNNSKSISWEATETTQGLRSEGRCNPISCFSSLFILLFFGYWNRSHEDHHWFTLWSLFSSSVEEETLFNLTFCSSPGQTEGIGENCLSLFVVIDSLPDASLFTLRIKQWQWEWEWVFSISSHMIVNGFTPNIAMWEIEKKQKSERKREVDHKDRTKLRETLHEDEKRNEKREGSVHKKQMSVSNEFVLHDMMLWCISWLKHEKHAPRKTGRLDRHVMLIQTQIPSWGKRVRSACISTL